MKYWSFYYAENGVVGMTKNMPKDEAQQFLTDGINAMRDVLQLGSQSGPLPEPPHITAAVNEAMARYRERWYDSGPKLTLAGSKPEVLENE